MKKKTETTPAAEPEIIKPNSFDRADDIEDFADPGPSFTNWEIENILPDLPGPSERRLSNLADIVQASGYCPGLTAAQIAIKLVVGEYLGLDPIAAVFDIEIEPGKPPRIRWNKDTPALEAKDRAEADRAALELATSDPALKAHNVRNDDAAGVKSPGLSIVPAKNGDLPVPGVSRPSDGSEEKRPYTQAPGPADQSAAPKLASAAAKNNAGLKPVPGLDQSVADLRRSWRSELEFMAGELGLDVAAKLAAFDALGNSAKEKEMFDLAKGYYNSQIEKRRIFILEALTKDGKETNEQRKGFFVYAGVNSHMDSWTLAEARKAEVSMLELMAERSGNTAA